ncbi:MAG TPA: response regulator transcription factor [Actinocrinis sp.]|nr:response regulator transcription factor [Actinocrinis sp.]
MIETAPAPARVLTVEDDPAIRTVIAMALQEARFDVREAGDGPGGVSVASAWAPDVVILDLNLPGFDGLEACRRIHGFSTAYVLMLSARADEVDKLVGLSTGADDYLTKPFSPRELVARVHALLRRSRRSSRLDSIDAPVADAAQPAQLARPADPSADERIFGALVVRSALRAAEVGGVPLDLTRIEFDLLDTLCGSMNQVHTRAQLRERVWGGDWMSDEHALDVHVSNLRRKLKDAGLQGAITTVRGVGYRITPEALAV